MNNLDTRTLEQTFQRLAHDGEKDAALTVAEMAFGSLKGTPREWLEDNYPDGLQETNKIQVIKQVRSEFDLGLKEAKAEVDEFAEEYRRDEDEWVVVSDPVRQGEVGLDVLIDGAEDTIIRLDPEDSSLPIRTRERGWITPDNRTWKFPASAVQ